MEASNGGGASRISTPDAERIKQRLLRKGVYPTPKIIHTLRKKEMLKYIRKSKRIVDKTLDKPLSGSDKQIMEEEAQFQTISREYKMVTKEFKVKRPWERLERNGFRELSSVSKEYGGKKLKGEHLKELSEILVKRNSEDNNWLLDDDIEQGDGNLMETEANKGFPIKRSVGDPEKNSYLVDRLSATDLSIRDWKFGRLMKLSGLHFTEGHLLKIVEGLGACGNWRIALSVVEWVYNNNDYKHQKSRFVYTKLLSVLGKARRPYEEDCHLYTDMPAYRSISVTLGQAGYVKDLTNIIEYMRHKPLKKRKNMRRKNWDPSLEPDVVVYNAVLNACIPSQQWKAVSWVLQQMRKGNLKTYGLAMEVMLKSGKYDLVHDLFGKMRRNGAAPKAITYKVLVKAFWEEGKVSEAVKVVRDMEQRGVVGSVSVYYELACCLCNSGRWQEAMIEIEKMKNLTVTKPLEVAFTGMILSCLDGGHVDDCISVFTQMMNHCAPNIGTINAMLKVYRRSDMFLKAKELFEDTKRRGSVSASASAHQWEYFEYVYKEMHLCGFQLDQNKHAWLLVEASIAGKWHLLEHAFDTILEAGEIPHPSLFTEMVCQTSVQHNYERAVTLVNSMAHAPFQVSENHEGVLQKLLDTLQSSKIVHEATVSNLSKSLISLCESSASKDSVGLIGPGYGASDKSPIMESLIYMRISKMGIMANSVFDSAPDIQDSNDNESIEVTLDLLTCDSNKLDKSGPPPASEILGAWKERRNKEGIFLPFNLQSK
ncbi:hypothetical protein MKX01_019414 [Papaver californicum]|nr:hypothetical protein MKX01_019414 [Papaver californicum]